MQARLSFLILFFSALLLSASPALSKGGSEPSDEGVSPRCEAAIDNAAGRYSKCLLKASAKDAKRGNEDRLLARQMRCEDKFNAQVARAQDRFGEERCTPYLSEIAERTATYAEGAATEASGTASPSFLFMQNGTGGTLSDTTLTLTDVSSQTGYFSDRPYRIAGQMNTDEFIRLWDEGQTFAEDPPNADFTCEVAGAVVNQAVTVTDPVLDEATGTLTYTAALVPSAGEGDSFSEITCDGDAHLFIDDDLMTTPSFICDGQAYHACKAAGGTWDMGTSTCTAGVTQAGCEAGGGTWDAGTSTCTPASNYNCFVGGFCSKLAIYYPPVTYGGGYYNAYNRDTPGTGPALAAGCDAVPGSNAWSSGKAAFVAICNSQIEVFGFFQPAPGCSAGVPVGGPEAGMCQ